MLQNLVHLEAIVLPKTDHALVWTVYLERR
jgi:hypothetical protein